MASNIPTSDSTCVVCLASNNMKTVGDCGHGVCIGCLSERIEESKNDGNTFSCPLCLSSCSIPEDGVNGLPEYTRQSSNPETSHSPATIFNEPERYIDGTGRNDVALQEDVGAKCSVCRLNGIEEPASVMCSACHKLYLCEKCKDLHSGNKATQDHVVTELLLDNGSDDLCQKHRSPLKTHCHTCEIAICSICVLFEHGDHNIENLADLVATKKIELNKLLIEHKKILSEFQEGKKQLMEMLETARETDKREDLIEVIEKQADRIIDSATLWKEQMKKEVNAKYDVIPYIEKDLKDYCKTVDDLKAPILMASEGLPKSGEKEQDFHNITTWTNDIQSIVKTQRVNITQQFERLDELILKDYTLLPEVTNFGEIVSPGFHPKEESKHELHGCPPKSLISHTCMIGNEFYALILYIGRHERTSLIYIHEFPSHTQKHKIDPGYICCGLSETPDGHLAVLVEKECYKDFFINMYDVSCGTVTSTLQIRLVPGTFALDMVVTSHYKFVILCRKDNPPDEVIFVADKDGNEESTYQVTNEYQLPTKGYIMQSMSCSGELLFVRGVKDIAIFKIKQSELQAIKTLHLDIDVSGLAATKQGILYAADCQGNIVRFQKVTRNEWLRKSGNIDNAKNQYCRLSTANDGRSVVSAYKKTIKIFSG